MLLWGATGHQNLWVGAGGGGGGGGKERVWAHDSTKSIQAARFQAAGGQKLK